MIKIIAVAAVLVMLIFSVISCSKSEASKAETMHERALISVAAGVKK